MIASGLNYLVSTNHRNGLVGKFFKITKGCSQVTKYEPKHFKTKLLINNMYLCDVDRSFSPHSLVKNDVKGKKIVCNKSD